MSASAVPYFSQWETRTLTASVLADGAEAALARDPLWAASGARTVDEYARWGAHVCGMACLKMILAARTGRAVPTLELARACTAHGGYVVDPDGAIRGLIYAPFVRFVAESFGIGARVVTGVDAPGLAAIMERSAFFMASVHPAIRWPGRAPPGRGGHLVLVTAASDDTIVFHNPSGHDRASQEGVALPVAVFGGFFAGRGIAIGPDGDRSPGIDGQAIDRSVSWPCRAAGTALPGRPRRTGPAPDGGSGRR